MSFCSGAHHHVILYIPVFCTRAGISLLYPLAAIKKLSMCPVYGTVEGVLSQCCMHSSINDCMETLFC